MRKKTSITLILLMLLGLQYCGYRLAGTGQYIPEHIKSIVIRNFDNKTSRYQAEQFVTFAVREEFLRRSKLQLKENIGEADSVLEGEIVGFDVIPMNYGDDISANTFRVIITINIKFLDLKNNQTIYESQRMTFTDTYDIDSGDFFSQETETLEKISKDFASSIVTSILENF